MELALATAALLLPWTIYAVIRRFRRAWWAIGAAVMVAFLAIGLDAARQPDGFAKIAIRLSEYRKLEPGALEEALFYDHPSGETRIRMAMQWKKDHVPGATMTKPEPVPAP